MIYSLFVQSLAIIAVTLFLVSFHLKSRKSILLMQLAGILIWATHFYLLSAWTGAVLITINGVVTILFLFKEKSKMLQSPLVLYSSLFVFLISTIITWEGFYSIFSLLGVSLIIIAKWQSNPAKIRLISLPASIFWIVYDYQVGAYGSITAEILVITSIILSLVCNNSKNY